MIDNTEITGTLNSVAEIKEYIERYINGQKLTFATTNVDDFENAELTCFVTKQSIEFLSKEDMLGEIPNVDIEVNAIFNKEDKRYYKTSFTANFDIVVSNGIKDNSVSYLILKRTINCAGKIGLIDWKNFK